MIILIPSYEPDHKLVDLVETLSAAPAPHQVLVVNDGSDPRFDPVFDKVRILGATVIEHHPNRGKGYALKRGFDYIATHYPDQDVVCADSDGQHTPEDIFAIANELVPGDDRIVLGARSFTGRDPAAQQVWQRCDPCSPPSGQRPSAPGHSDRSAWLSGIATALAGNHRRRPVRIRTQCAARGEAERYRRDRGADRHGLHRRQRIIALPTCHRLDPGLSAVGPVQHVIACCSRSRLRACAGS